MKNGAEKTEVEDFKDKYIKSLDSENATLAVLGDVRTDLMVKSSFMDLLTVIKGVRDSNNRLHLYDSVMTLQWTINHKYAKK